MSNVFLSIAIRSCCEARSTRKLGIQRALSSFKQRNATVQRTFIPQQCHLRPAINHVRAAARQLSISAHLQAVKDSVTAGGLPSSNLEPATTSASHTEGVLDTESWRDYDPAGGLPLPDGELEHDRIKIIFAQQDIDIDLGNYILSVLHWRRMSGALIDVGIAFPRSVGVTPQQALRGLEFLRQRYPEVDEQGLGARWAEEESMKMRQELQDRAVKLRLYKPTKTEEAVEEEEDFEEEESQQGTEYGRERSGTSAAEGLFKAMRIKRAEAEEQKAIKQAQKERSLLHMARGPLELAGGVQRTVGVKRYGTFDVVLREPDAVASLRPIERKPWVKHYEDQALITKEETVPQISTFRRLFPSFLVMLATVGLCLYVSNNYTPPPTEARLFPEIPPSVATIGAITAVMCAAFVLSRLPPLWRFNNRYLCIVPAYPFAISNIGAIFRHDTLGHLATNMITLWLVGLTLHEDVGRGTFLAIVLGTGVVGTYSALVYNVMAKQWLTYIFGSSGAVLGVLGALCTLRPNGMVSIFGYELPIAAWLLLLAVGGTEVVAALRMTKTTLDHAGHLGGLISGVAGAAYLKHKWQSDVQSQPVMKAGAHST